MAWSDLVARVWPAVGNFNRHRGALDAREDLAYGELAKQRLDLFLPEGNGPFPLVVFFHGGFWKPQDRKLFRWASGLYGNVGAALAGEGVAVAVPSYRQDVWANTEHDALAAIAWLRAHAGEHKLDATRLSLAGHSAGGHLALALAWDPKHRAGEVRAVVSMCSVYDLPRLARGGIASFNEPDALRYFGDAAAMERLSPERHLRASEAPLMLVTCADDPSALREEHAAFATACLGAGVRCETLDVPGVGHMGVVLEMGQARDRVTRPLARFVIEQSFDVAGAWTLDVAALLNAELRPARPRLDAAKAAVVGATTGEAALEALVARSLLSASPRCFSRYVRCPACGGSGSGDHGGPCLTCFRAKVALAPPRSAPASVADAVSLASLSEDAIEAVERHALRCAEALVAWGFVAPTRVCWCVASARGWRRRRAVTVEPSRYASEACEAAGSRLDGVIRAFERALDGRPERDPESELVVDLENAIVWRAAVQRGFGVSPSRGAHGGDKHPVGKAFSELADPFEGLCGVWARGCAFDGVEPDGTVVVVVPEV